MTISCEDLKARAIIAARERKAQNELATERFLREWENKGYVQLKATFPMLTRDGDQYDLCGHRFHIRSIGTTLDGETHYVLESLATGYGLWVDDEASFGSFLLRLEEKEEEEKSCSTNRPKGFWASLFS